MVSADLPGKSQHAVPKSGTDRHRIDHRAGTALGFADQICYGVGDLVEKGLNGGGMAGLLPM